MGQRVVHKIVQKSTIWYGGSDWHRLAQSAAEIVALEKGFRSEETALYRSKMTYQPDLIIEKMDRFVSGPRRFNKKVRYAVEIVLTHGPSKEQVKEALNQGFDDILLIRKKNLKNKDSIKELLELCRKVIP